VNRALFVSDIHIQSAEDRNGRLFDRFLDRCLNLRPDILFLVGDIFDLWIADRKYFVETYANTIRRIRELRGCGVEVYYFEGNHDLDLKHFWHEQLGVKVFEQAAYFDLLGRTVRVEHGDQMDPDDKGYLFLRWLLRTPAMKEVGRRIPDPAVKFIGEKASRASRDYTSTLKSVSDADVKTKFLRHIDVAFKEKPFDILVSGHVHVAQDVAIARDSRKVRAFNLGTWLKEPLVLDMRRDGVDLTPVEDFLGK
jgi:UDP-2,3-diacylglucosamine hydrolase